MDVHEDALRTILEGTKQYSVPLYQRPYSWEKGQVQRLWNDIERLTEERQLAPSAQHFMGSLVLSLGRMGPSESEFLVVDGQQRLTTLSILLCALRDYVRINEPDGEQAYAKIHETYLVNRFSTGDKYLKVMPTQADREAFKAIIDGRQPEDAKSNIAIAYRFFATKIAAADDPDDPYDIANIEAAILQGLVFVSITAKGDDNVYRIFESLNNTGKALTQGDLLRNYVFMRLGVRGEEIYEAVWLPMQRLLGSDDLQQLFWLDIVMHQPLVTQTEVYASQQKRLDALSDEQIVNEVHRWADLARLLATMRDPRRETDEALRLRLERLRDWGTSTVEPIVLQLLARRSSGVDEVSDVSEALRILESFLVRRVIVGRATAGLNRILLSIGAELTESEPSAETVRRTLSSGRKTFATDAEIDQAVLAIPFYFQGRPIQRKLILDWLERSFGSKEAVDAERATIEHVMPQTLTSDWSNALAPYVTEGETIESLHAGLVHTLGNLTLTAYNSELSNRSFAVKREMLANSGFMMNREIAESSEWTQDTIHARARQLAETIKREWPGPVAVENVVRSGVNWELAHQAVSTLAEGEWTSYGDLAALIGTHANPMGQHMAKIDLPGAWRVLQSGGSISPGFRWSEPDDHRDPLEALTAEGLTFDEKGRASLSQRVSAEMFASRLGLEPGQPLLGLDVPEGDNDRAEKFLSQLEDNNSPSVVHGVLTLMKNWSALGGELEYGLGETVSCVFLVPEEVARMRRVRPIAIYPDISIEVAFQHLQVRPPFDSEALREEFRVLLNRAPGVELPASRLRSRPPIPIEVVGDEMARNEISDALAWFYRTVEQAEFGDTGKSD